MDFRLRNHRIINFIIFSVSTFLKKVGMIPKSSRIRGLLSFNGKFKIETRNGSFFYMQNADRWIETSLFWEGLNGYEKSTIDLFYEELRDAQTVFDIGANSGLFSLIASTKPNNIKVVAFEPIEFFADVIRKNNELNSYKIIVEQCAVSENDGVFDFFKPAPNQGNIYSSSLSQQHYNLHQNTKPEIQKVKVIRLDSYINANKLDSLSLIKIDAEGHDLLVLKSLGVYLERYKPKVIIEIQSAENAKLFYELLAPLGYSFFSIEVNGLIPIDKKKYTGALNYFAKIV